MALAYEFIKSKELDGLLRSEPLMTEIHNLNNNKDVERRFTNNRKKEKKTFDDDFDENEEDKVEENYKSNNEENINNNEKVTKEENVEMKINNEETSDEQKEEEKVEDEEDNEDDWIGPNNLEEKLHKYLGTANEDTTELNKIYIKIISGDFTVQNVALKMGIPILSIDGLRVKTIKNYILKCYACNRYHLLI